jgi:predicted HAD superfamily phosphohydrolase
MSDEEAKELFANLHVLLVDLPSSEGQSLMQLITSNGGKATITEHPSEVNDATHIVTSGNDIVDDRSYEFQELVKKGKALNFNASQFNNLRNPHSE